MRYLLSFLTLISLFTGCSQMNRAKPSLSVGINSFRMVPTQGVVPRFEIGLHVVNTGPADVDIRGVVYKVYLQNHKVLTGAANDLPEIPAYGERDILVKGTPDLFETIGFFKDMVSSNGGSVDYVVDVAIDAGSWMPMIHTKKEGRLSLSNLDR